MIYVILILILLIWFSYKSYPIFSDENIYINMAYSMTKNLLPYKDFFYAHTPLSNFFLAVFLKIFGNSFLVVKIFETINLTLIIILLYKITKSKYSLIFFSLHPIFLIFGNLFIGYFDALMILLLSFYLLKKNNLFLSSILFSLAIFTRQLSIFFLPIFFYYSKEKIKFLTVSFIFLTILFASFPLNKIIDNVFLYHIQRLSTNLTFDFQYFSFGIFNILALLALLVFSKKEKFLIIFILFYEIFIAIFIKQQIYHYFVLSLGFISILIKNIENKPFLKKIIFVIIVLNIISNYKSFEYYLNKENFKILNIATKLVNEGNIFGEPIVTNYVSFINNLNITNNIFDTDLKRLNKYKKDFLLAFKSSPKFLITYSNYFESIGEFDKYFKNYKLIYESEERKIYKRVEN